MQTPRTPAPIRHYAQALMDSADQLNTVLAQMHEFSEKRPHPRAKPPPIVLGELLEGILTDNLERFHPADVKRATELLRAATEAVGNDLFFVDPDLMEDHGIPDLN